MLKVFGRSSTHRQCQMARSCPEPTYKRPAESIPFRQSRRHTMIRPHIQLMPLPTVSEGAIAPRPTANPAIPSLPCRVSRPVVVEDFELVLCLRVVVLGYSKNLFNLLDANLVIRLIIRACFVFPRAEVLDLLTAVLHFRKTERGRGALQEVT